DGASSMAAHWMSTDSSAAFRPRSRSLAKVAMPHCRGGQVDTNATDRLRPRTRFEWSGIACRRSRLGAQPVQDLSNLRTHKPHAGIGGSVIHAQFARNAVAHR